MEILAPAGSPEHITAAVRSGANAVYLGTKNFNARKNARNFTANELKEAITYCHARDVKVYLALNTLVTDYELDLAKNEIITAAELGADAVIIQDLALLSLIKTIVPQMPIHASTQMSVHNVSGAKMLEKLGFSRVVPARELSMKELEIIKANTSLELEVFVHGALCMCVSGQCYMSSVFGQRSANRGMCAQPCRLNFTGSGRDHALSLKDLSAVDMLAALDKLKITSAKIEGRMKRPEYVAAAVKSCVCALSGKSYDKKRLQAVFSRSGFTNGYLENNINQNMFGYRTKDDVISASPVLKEIASEYRNEVPLIGVDMHIEIKRGKNIALTVCDGKNTVKICKDMPQEAINKAVDKKTAEASLKKCGGTPFYPVNIICNIDSGLSVSMAQLNSLRKEALNALLEKRSIIKAYTINKNCTEYLSQDIPLFNYPKIFARFKSIEQICENVDNIIIDIDLILKNPSVCTKYRGKLTAEMPSLLFTEDRIDAKLTALKAYGVDTLYAPNIYVLELAKRHGFKTLGGFGLNIMNSAALNKYSKAGLDMTEISFECSLSRFNALTKTVPCGLAAYGKMPLMSCRACPARTEKGCKSCGGRNSITDRFNNKMTVMCKDKIYSQILNPQPIYMADRLCEIKNAAFITLYFTDEKKSECQDIIQKYKHGESTDKKYTRGLYYKEIK